MHYCARNEMQSMRGFITLVIFPALERPPEAPERYKCQVVGAVTESFLVKAAGEPDDKLEAEPCSSEPFPV